MLRHPESSTWVIQWYSAAQRGIGGHYRFGVARQVNFWHNRDTQQPCPFVDGAQLLDGVGASVRYVIMLGDVVTIVVVGWWLVPSYRSRTPGPYRGQTWPPRYRQAPSLVVGEV